MIPRLDRLDKQVALEIGQKLRGRALLGLDHGTKRIGVAISDRDWILASPLGIYNSKPFKSLIGQITEVVTDRRVGALIFGLPRNMDGTSGRQAQSAQDFAIAVKKEIDLPIFFWDERLSSQEAARIRPPGKTGKFLDDIAAAIILTSCMDFFRNLLPPAAD